MERVFRASVKFEENGQWSSREADTIGFFVKREEDSNVIEGYFEMQYNTAFNPIRYIKGLFIEERKLVWMQMCNDFLYPVCYVFHDITERGFWSGFNKNGGFFPQGNFNGHAMITLKEITDETEKKGMEKEIMYIFEKNRDKDGPMRLPNSGLLQETQVLMDFLDENSPWYPKD